MTEYSIRLALPHCDDCHKPRNKNENTTHIALMIPKKVIQKAEDSVADDLTSRMRRQVNHVQLDMGDEEDEL